MPYSSTENLAQLSCLLRSSSRPFLPPVGSTYAVTEMTTAPRGLLDPAISVKIVEVAKKYDEPEVSRPQRAS